MGRVAAGPDNQPSTCQRARSATAAASDRGAPLARAGPSRRQQRSWVSPCSVWAVTTTWVQARPHPPSRSTSSSARVRATKATASARSAGGSRSAATVTSGGTGSGRSSWGSSPRARRCTHCPAGPKRATTAPVGSAPTSPMVVRPRRSQVSSTSGSGTKAASAASGAGARNAAAVPGGTTRGRPRPARVAASRATRGPSATPTRTSRSGPAPAAAAAARWARASSPPK